MNVFIVRDHVAGDAKCVFLFQPVIGEPQWSMGERQNTTWIFNRQTDKRLVTIRQSVPVNLISMSLECGRKPG